MRVELETYQGKGESQIEMQRKERLKELNEALSKASLKAAKIEEKNSKIKERMYSLKECIETLYNVLECEEIAPYELKSIEGVTESNILVYLKVIEKRKTDILLAIAELAKTKEKNGESLQTYPGLNINQLTMGQDNDMQRTSTNELFTRVDPVKCEITSEELLSSSNIDEFRKKIESRIKSNAATKIEDI